MRYKEAAMICPVCGDEFVDKSGARRNSCTPCRRVRNDYLYRYKTRAEIEKATLINRRRYLVLKSFMDGEFAPAWERPDKKRADGLREGDDW